MKISTSRVHIRVLLRNLSALIYALLIFPAFNNTNTFESLQLFWQRSISAKYASNSSIFLQPIFSVAVYDANTPFDANITESTNANPNKINAEETAEIISASDTGEAVIYTDEDTYSELIGFVVRGRHLYERLQIDDLDALITPDEQRWIPLLRILHAFKLAINEEDGIIRFSPEGVGPVELNIESQEITIAGSTRPIRFIEAVSDITMESDIYITPEDMSDILNMELVWDSALYEFRVQLDRKLSIWQLDMGGSLLDTKTTFVEADIPEALPAAEPSKASLQFLEFQWRPTYRYRSNWGESDAESGTHYFDVSSPKEIIWGNVYNGQYKLELSQAGPLWESTEDQWYWRNNEPYAMKVDWIEWIHRRPSSEIAFGDSTFGLSELIYPVFDVTGVRFNGLIGYDDDEIENDKSRLGLRNYFGKTYVFEGTAPIGSTIELLLNGRTVDIQEAFPEEDSPPGFGVYRFEDIELPSGILNEITIVIKEANGNEIRVERSILGTPQLLDKNKSAYIGVLGTKREMAMPEKEDIEIGRFFGEIVGGRYLYGLTDRVTIGVILGFERDHYKRFLESPTSFGRSYPRSSGNVGFMVSYLPFDNLFVSGDFAVSTGEGQDNYNDSAMRIRAEYLPTENLSFHSDFLNIGTNYFDGQDPDIADRRGGEVGLRWKYSKQWSIEGGFGTVRNNLDGTLSETLSVDYQNIGIQTSVIPRSTFSVTYNRLSANTIDEPMDLFEFRTRTRIGNDMDIYGQISFGEELTLADDNRFLSQLRLRNAPRFTYPSQYWVVRKIIDQSNIISFIYSDTNFEDTLSLVHDLNVNIKGNPLRVRTEFIKELTNIDEYGEFGFRSRVEYLLDEMGYNRFGLTAEYRREQFRLMAYFNIRNLYSRHHSKFININDQRIRTAYGAVHGLVFLDYNGNNLLDPNEPGIPNVKVSLGRFRSTVTNDDGYYILAGLPNMSQGRIYLDIDTVPAIYTITHGTQLAKVYRDSITEVNLALAPLISIIGRVVALDDEGGLVPQSGVRVELNSKKTGRLVTDSYTAEDGSYYLGELTPGSYTIEVEQQTLQSGLELEEFSRDVEVISSRVEIQEIELADFIAGITSEFQKEIESSEPAEVTESQTQTNIELQGRTEQQPQQPERPRPVIIINTSIKRPQPVEPNDINDVTIMEQFEPNMVEIIEDVNEVETELDSRPDAQRDSKIEYQQFEQPDSNKPMIVINTAIINYSTKEQSQEPNIIDIQPLSDDPNSVQNSQLPDQAQQDKDKALDNIEDKKESPITDTQRQLEHYISSRTMIIINTGRTN